MSRSADQTEQVGTRPVDLPVVGAGVVERDHVPQRGAELLAGRGVFVVKFGRVFTPAGGNLSDRETVAESAGKILAYLEQRGLIG